MLVLSRREQQKIRLGDSIVVTIVRVSGDRVRIGIEAPQGLRILRDELEPFDTRGPSVGPSAKAAPVVQPISANSKRTDPESESAVLAGGLSG